MTLTGPQKEALLAAQEARTKMKTAVTRKVTRVNNGASNAYTEDAMKILLKELETTYSKFEDTHEEYDSMCIDYNAPSDYLVINNLDMSAYKAVVHEKFKEGRKLFNDYMNTLLPVTVPIASQGSAPQPTPSPTPQMYLKKQDPPPFSGFFPDYPEWEALWEKMMSPIPNKTALAYYLKKACENGPAIHEIDHISAGSEGAYDKMWEALKAHYGNITLSVNAAVAGISKLSITGEGDFSGQVKLYRDVQKIYFQLEHLQQTSMVSVRELNEILQYMPPSLKKDWYEKYTTLDASNQLKPFPEFHKFLTGKLKTAKLMAETEAAFPSKASSSTLHTESSESYSTHTPGTGNTRFQGGRADSSKATRHQTNNDSTKPRPSPNDSSKSSARTPCLLPEHHSMDHSTTECRKFQSLSQEARVKLWKDAALTKKPRCAKCLNVKKEKICGCPRMYCTRCNMANHNALVCRSETTNTRQDTSNKPKAESNATGQEEAEAESAGKPQISKSGSSTHLDANSTSLDASPVYAMYNVPVTSSNLMAKVCCDDCSDATYITETAAVNLNATLVKATNLTMTTLLGTQDIRSSIYTLELISKRGTKIPITAYTRPKLTADAVELNYTELSSIFPEHDLKSFSRPIGKIDILLGLDQYDLHPQEKIASAGKLTIKDGPLGTCLIGSHPSAHASSNNNNSSTASESATVDSAFACTNPHTTHVSAFHVACSEKQDIVDQHDPNVPSFISAYATAAKEENFIEGEQLGTVVNPRCGGCRCGKCPQPGATYSFSEEKELKMIKDNLRYDPEKCCWFTSYPWLRDPAGLPNNYPAALATLISTEKKLRTEPEWADTYAAQIEEHEERGVARKLSKQELDSWRGPVFYLSTMVLEQPKSLSTPVRLVFNSSQIYKNTSLNSFLAKGPDAYNNKLLGLLITFRELPVVLIGDIRKMYNSVHLEELECHVHRFLWRDMEDRPPDTWCITRVNLGDRPSGTIAIVARDLTAEKFRHINPEAADMIINKTFTDDLINTVLTFPIAQTLANDADEILKPGGFYTKGWTFGGEGVENDDPDPKLVLGTTWIIQDDTISVPAKINFSKKRRKIRTGPPVTLETLLTSAPPTFTLRLVLEQVMSIYDPYGLLAPLSLHAKILLRKIWTLKLKWDDPLPEEMRCEWLEFFRQVLEAEKLRFPRCLKPINAMGNPSLVIFSDGSDTAYGCAAYVHWKLDDGTCWSRLVLAKCRIAPIQKVSTPRMELNGAVISTRIRKFLETECRFKFEQVVQLVDSLTVLQQIHSTSTRFKVYEGVRLGEIQSATSGDLKSWAWIAGSDNIADWVTRPKTPADIGPDSQWFNGPEFMKRPIEEWEIKVNPTKPTELLPGENVHIAAYATTAAYSSPTEASLIRNSNIHVVYGAYARIIAGFRQKSLKKPLVTPEYLKEAKDYLIKEAQSDFTPNLLKKQFRTLNPQLKDEIYVVGTRIAHSSPLSPDNSPQTLLPPNHMLTRRLMKAAHEDCCHGGRDKSLAKFRAEFWTSHAAQSMSAICSSCQRCKLLKAIKLKQQMGIIPPERLIPAPPFNSSALDLFGPFSVRGEVQKRTSGKAWGLIITDICSRAVHIEAMFGYSTEQFMIALRRFTSLRGWPAVIYSDPGTQLKGAESDLKKVWESIDLETLQILGAHKGLKWTFGPPDSPWYQGTVEALIKTAKKAISVAVGNSRLSVPEILTVFTESANMINERPIGYMPSPDSHINILTPNSLLLGRSSAQNPGGYDPDPTPQSRLSLVENITNQFWKSWTELYVPMLVKQSKWHTGDTPIKKGDVVIVSESNPLKAEYRIARVHKPIESADGLIRKAEIAYKNFKVGEALHEYSGARDKIVERAVQNMSLLAPTVPD